MTWQHPDKVWYISPRTVIIKYCQQRPKATPISPQPQPNITKTKRVDIVFQSKSDHETFHC